MEREKPKKSSRRRKGAGWTALRVVRGLVLAYVVVAILAWALQSKLVYFPEREVPVTPADLGVRYEEVPLTASDGTKLSAWFVPAPNEKGVVLFCHGNGGNICHRLESLGVFHNLGYSVLIFDYRGYGRSEGSPSEEGTYLDARAAWENLVTARKIPPERIVLFGRSLGGAVAAKLASETSPAGLIVESSFTSIPDVGAERFWFLPVRLLCRYKYNTAKAVGRAGCAVLVIHSRDDDVTPFAHGRRLYEVATEPKEFIEISGTHNRGFLTSGQTYTTGLGRFLGRCTGGADTRPARTIIRHEDG